MGEPLPLLDQAAAASQQSRVHLSVTPAEASNFLRALATDDSFRARFTRDPQAVLAESHIFLPPGAIPSNVVLPSKEELQAAIAQLPGTVQISSHWVWAVWIAFIVAVSQSGRDATVAE